MSRYVERKEAMKELKKIVTNKSHYFIIHYSCEGDGAWENGKNARIANIAVRCLDGLQTEYFSVSTEAEISKIELDNDDSLLECEKKVLCKFYAFVKANQNRGVHWLHMKMRDNKYGFNALSDRYECIFGHVPECVPDLNSRVDLSDLLKDAYAWKFEGDPPIGSLAKLNGLLREQDDFMAGKDEAIAFKAHEYGKMRFSIARKVDILEKFIEYAANGKLKTGAKWYEVYGISIQGLYDLVKGHWVLGLISLVLSALLGAVFGHFLF